MENKTRKVNNRWFISDELWKEIQSLLPSVVNRHRFGGGRPRIPDPKVMNGIFFVLRTGCQWKALDATGICSGSVAHSRFVAWCKAGVFKAFWKLGLERYDETRGIDWQWQALDTSFAKAPVAGSKKNRQKPHGSRQTRGQTVDPHRRAWRSTGHRGRRGKYPRLQASRNNAKFDHRKETKSEASASTLAR